MAFGSFEVGVIQRTPVPELSAADREALAGLARRAWALKRSLDTRNETSHAFELPALLSCIRNASSVRAEVSKHEYSLAMRAAMWGERARAVDAELASIQAEIDERCFDLYGIGEEDRRAIAPEKAGPMPADGDDAAIDSDKYTDEAGAEADDGYEADDDAAADAAGLTAELVSWAFGAAFGRFDVRLATGGREPPPAPAPFDPLPACSAGMLTGPDGLPCAAPPEGYPVAFPENGILVDDPGHPRDIEPLVRSILDAIVFAGQPVEQEICEILGVKSLREYFRKPALFFADHLKRYSKSRRKAPIYWPLSTASGSYTLWVYYHRLTDQTLYACITDFVEPKIADVEKDLARVRARMGEAPSAKDRKAAEELESLLHELKDFRDELLRVAKLPYKPDLNDGVMITAAPLARLFLHKPWQKELLACWKKLEAGE
ncbi:MAG TPA: hypothetical protein PLU72_16585, partial [Candidatus Ozemobacteraceae bacterium]|nr:hypothetical protein [Candidatus Ozemobacteraceae bacterium]